MHFRKIALSVATLFLLAGPAAHAEREPLTTGTEAPALFVDELLQAPKGAKFRPQDLRGKVVVYDFWATWCPPCVASLPHWNELVTQFAGQPVVFVAVTDDSAERLEPFLKNHPIKSPIGIDRKRANWQPFDVVSIPHAMVIDKNGRIAAITFPENITAEALQRVLRNEPIALAPKEGRPDNLEWDDELIEWKDGVPPLFSILIKPMKTTTSGSWVRPEGDHLTADGVPLSVLLQMAYQADHYHIDMRAPVPKQNYRVAARVPKGREAALLPVFQQSLNAMFALSTRWEEQERDVLILQKASPDVSLPESTSQPLFQSMKGVITLKKQPVERLTGQLTQHFDTVVVDGTGLKGNYDFVLPYQPGEPQVLKDALGKLGLRLEKSRRPVRILVVENDPATNKAAAAGEVKAAESNSERLVALAADAGKLESFVRENESRLTAIDFQNALGMLQGEERYAGMVVLAESALSWLQRQQSNKDANFYSYYFKYSRGLALLNLGRAGEAIPALLSAAEHSPVSKSGVAVYSYERDLAKAYLNVGEFDKALETIAPVYAMTNTPYTKDVLYAAYEKSGRDMTRIDGYVESVRKKHAVRMEGQGLGLTDAAGATVDLRRLRGKATVVTSWFIGCAACRNEMVFLQKMLEQYNGQGLRVVAVDLFGAGAKGEEYRQKTYTGAKFPFIQNPAGKAGALVKDYGANGNHTWLLNEAGDIVYTQGGWGKDLEPVLEQRVRQELKLE